MAIRICGRNLSGALFNAMDLRGSQFTVCDLRNAHFQYCNLVDVNFSGSKLDGANFIGATGLDSTIGLLEQYPAPQGQFIGYKAIKVAPGRLGIVKLLVPEEARRVRPLGSHIIRVDRARPLEIVSDGVFYTSGFSCRDPEFEYVVGKLAVPYHAYSADITVECASGLHLFVNRLDAETYW